MKPYTIYEDFADSPASLGGTVGKIGQGIDIYLNARDWNRFESQPFYQEMIRFLDNLEIQKNT